MAANADTRQLQLQISASAELLIRNLKTADNAVADFQRSTDRRLGAVDASFAAVGKLRGRLGELDGRVGIGGLASAATGVTLVELARRGLDYASSLQEVSQQLGVTSRDLQVYRYAATQVGIEQETIDKGLQKLTLTMGQAEAGAKKPAAAFGALGIALETLKGKTAGDVLPAIANGLANIGDPAQRAAVEVALFGKAGQQLDTLLAGGSGQIDELTKAAERLGLVLSSKEIADADATADKIAEVKQVLEASIAHAVADNAGSILQLADSLEVLLGKISRFNPAYSGFLRILTKDGVGAAARSFLGDGSDQTQASTDRGYAQLKIDQFKQAREAYRRAKADPTRNRGQVADYASKVRTARAAADKAAGDYLASQGRAGTEGKTLASQVITGDGRSTYRTDGNGGGGKSAAQVASAAAAEAKRDRQAQRRANDLVARADLDVLSARADLSGDPQERLAIERQRIDQAKTARDADFDEQAIDNRFIAAKLQRLKAANASAAELDRQLAAQRVQQQDASAAFERQQASSDDAIAITQIEAGLAVVARDRYAIERRLLALRQRQERNVLDDIINDSTGRYSPGDKLKAREALDRLPERQAAERAAQAQQQQGPLASYRDRLNAAVGDTDEALQGVAVNGLQSLEDGLLGVITGTESLASAFKKMAASIISDLIRIAIQKAIVSAVGGGSFFGLADGGSIGSVPGRADGGSLGGLISGPGTGRSDSILALLGGPGGGAVRLSNREFIMNERAVDFYGPGMMDALNARRLPRFAGGGSLGGRLPSAIAPRLPDLGSTARRDRVIVEGDIRVAPTPQLYAEMTSLSFRAVGAAAEPIMAGAEARTMKRFQRPGLPGAPG